MGRRTVDSNLESDNLDREDSEEGPRKLERRSRIQVYQSRQLEVEELHRKKIEEESEKYRENLAEIVLETEGNHISESERHSDNEEEYDSLYNTEEEEREAKDGYEDKKKKGEEDGTVKKRRKERRKTKKSIEAEFLKKKKEFLGEVEDFESEEEYVGEIEVEGEADIDFQYYGRMFGSSSTVSFLSAISFEWEDKVYEFEELYDPGNIDSIYQRHSVAADNNDGIGRLRYLDICKNLRVAPITRFVDGLENSEIDLSLRAFDVNSIRAISAALEINNYVKKLVLSCSKISVEECRFLGLMLKYNDALLELNISGCRIGPEGIKKLVEFLPQNHTLEVLNLSKCNIEDEGMVALSEALNGNNSLRVLDLSYNKLGEDSVAALSMAIEFNFSIHDLNLSYNYFFSPTATKELFHALTNNDYIKKLNLSWNGMSGKEIGSHVGNYLKKSKTIQELDLSDNRFQGPAMKEIRKGLSKSTTMEILKLGKNPASPKDLEVLLGGAKGCSTLNLLDLEELWVEKTFMKSLDKIRATRNLEVILGGIFGNYEIKGPDYPAVLLKRAQYEGQKPKRKKQKRDFGHLIWTLGDEPLTVNEFMEKVQKFKAKINKELFPELVEQFLIPNKNLIDVVAMKAKYLSLFPNSSPPPAKKIKTKGKKGKKTKEVKEAVDSKTKKVAFTPRVAFQDEEKKHKITPIIKVKQVQKQEEESEEEIEGEGGLVFTNLVIEPWILSDEEGELFAYSSEEESEEEEKEDELENLGSKLVVLKESFATQNSIQIDKSQNGPGIVGAW